MSSRISGFSDTKERKAETMANAAVLACTESGQQPSAICTKLGIPTSFRWSRLPYVPFPFRVERIVKISQMREAERLQTKGKIIETYGYHT
jgi:2-keto-3-deoxy-galactonokinase